MENVLVWLGPIIQQYAAQYPLLFTVAVILGSFRLFFKPVMTIIENIVGLTVSKKDDEILAKVVAHPVYKGFAFFVDWIASIKLPKKEEKPSGQGK